MGAYWESLAFPIGQEAYGEPRGHALERQRATSPIVEVFGSLGAPTSNGTALRHKCIFVLDPLPVATFVDFYGA